MTVTPKLASAVHGQAEEMFFLQKARGRSAGGTGGDDAAGAFDGAGGGSGGAGFGFNREGMEARIQAELARLPADQRAAAQARIDEFKALRDSMKDLTAEQRRAKLEEMMSDPSRQEKMEGRQAAKDAQRSPEQRLERAHQYVQNKAAATGGGAK